MEKQVRQMRHSKIKGQFSKGKRRKKEQHPFGKAEKQWKVEEREAEELKSRYGTIDSATISKFTDFPLSAKTLEGLKMHKYEVPTDIQRQSIGLALQSHDVLGAAKTGSGKTLAFLIPILERLNTLRWSSHDGLGALIISPTRELAYQTFEVLRKVGKKHDFSAGLVIGGKHVKEEAARINNTNIVICTPGRLLQHMDETVNFSAHTLQVLVLDEADRILDLGFQQTMNAIIDNLPTERQTLLFSATQTKSVKELARLSLKDPMYVSVHEHAKHSTPAKLQQSYVVCELHEKLDVLWSFIKHHPKSKVIVFMMCCKQVRYLHDAFCRLRPGTSILALHGAMKQLKRVAVYDQFCRKQHAVLFATDIAARGLDFPAVNWVVQLDCPEDSNTYIHRAGRTARYEQDGEALLILLPSEEAAMLEHLKTKKIPIEQIKVNSKRMTSIQGKLEANLAADVALKESAQRAFVSYLRSVFLMKDKAVFDIGQLETDLYAHSLGLAIPPRIRFLEKQAKQKQNRTRVAESESELSSKMKRNAKIESKTKKMADVSLAASGDSEIDANERNTKVRTNDMKTEPSSSETESSDEDSDIEREKSSKGGSSGGDVGANFNFSVGEDDLDDILTVKNSSSEVLQKSNEEDEDDPVMENDERKSSKSKPLTKYALAKKLKKKNLQVNQKVVFNDEGEVVSDSLKKQKVSLDNEEDLGGINIAVAKQRMQEEDKYDKQLFREKIKKRHREERLKQKAARRAAQADRMEDEPIAVLGSTASDAEESDAGDDSVTSGGRVVDESESSDNERHSNHSSSESDSDVEESIPIKRSKRGSNSEEMLDTGLSLDDDEAIALRLLQS